MSATVLRRRIAFQSCCLRLGTTFSVCLVVLALAGLASAGSGSCSLGSAGHVNYQTTYSSGLCGQGGDTQYETWAFNTFVYVDASGHNHSLGGSASYSWLSSGSYTIGCPPYGPEPTNGLVLDGSGYQITFYPEYEGYASCKITE
jgi:hypothetical protein